MNNNLMTKTRHNKLANYSIDESSCKVDHSKDDKNCGHDKVSEVEAYVYLFRSLTLKVVLKRGCIE